MNYTPKVWENSTLGPIFSEILYANNTINGGYVRILDNIKYKQIVTSISGSMAIQDYAVSPVTAGSITFSDTVIEPLKKHFFHTFEMDTLRSSRFGAGMPSGAANMESNEFLKTVLEFAVPNIGKEIEKGYWATLTTKLAAATNEIAVAGVILTSGNIAGQIQRVFEAIPGEVIASSEAAIYAPASAYSLIKVANVSATYRDIFTVTGTDVDYLGVPVRFVPLAANTIIAGRASDLILGTDLAADFAQLEVGKDNPSSDLMYLKLTFSLDAAVCVTNQKVLYKV